MIFFAYYCVEKQHIIDMRNVTITKISNGYLLNIPEFINRTDYIFDGNEQMESIYRKENTGDNVESKNVSTPFIPNMKEVKFFASLQDIFTHLSSIEQNEMNPEKHYVSPVHATIMPSLTQLGHPHL